jgi:hypothetical protein
MRPGLAGVEGVAEFLQDALTRAHAGGGVAWIALQDPEEAEVESVFTAIGQGDPADRAPTSGGATPASSGCRTTTRSP